MTPYYDFFICVKTHSFHFDFFYILIHMKRHIFGNMKKLSYITNIINN